MSSRGKRLVSLVTASSEAVKTSEVVTGKCNFEVMLTVYILIIKIANLNINNFLFIYR